MTEQQLEDLIGFVNGEEFSKIVIHAADISLQKRLGITSKSKLRISIDKSLAETTYSPGFVIQIAKDLGASIEDVQEAVAGVLKRNKEKDVSRANAFFEYIKDSFSNIRDFFTNLKPSLRFQSFSRESKPYISTPYLIGVLAINEFKISLPLISGDYSKINKNYLIPHSNINRNYLIQTRDYLNFPLKSTKYQNYNNLFLKID